MDGKVWCGAPTALLRVIRLLGVSTLVGFLGAGPAQAAEDPYDGNLRFSLSPYLWLPSFSSTLRFNLPNGSPDVDVGAGALLKNLDFALMGAGDVRMGNWSGFTDFIYLKLSNDNSTVRSVTGPGGVVDIPVDIGTSTSLKGFVWTLAASYTLFHGPAASFDVFAGFRDAQFKTSLDWRFAGPLGAFPQTGSTSDTAVIWDGIIGLKGRIRLSQSGTWYIPYYADVGWGSSSSTWQGLIGVGYAFSWGDLYLTYRHLHYDTKGSRAIDNLSLHGPTLGATFHF